MIMSNKALAEILIKDCQEKQYIFTKDDCITAIISAKYFLAIENNILDDTDIENIKKSVLESARLLTESINYKHIENYEKYLITDQGKVFSLKTMKWLSLWANQKGYLYATLTDRDGIKNMRVHRLVASAFIPNDDETKDTVDHINGNKQDNKVSNLRWMTRGENARLGNLGKKRSPESIAK